MSVDGDRQTYQTEIHNEQRHKPYTIVGFKTMFRINTLAQK
jgi:hypothetical protein